MDFLEITNLTATNISNIVVAFARQRRITFRREKRAEKPPPPFRLTSSRGGFRLVSPFPESRQTRFGFSHPRRCNSLANPLARKGNHGNIANKNCSWHLQNAFFPSKRNDFDPETGMYIYMHSHENCFIDEALEQRQLASSRAARGKNTIKNIRSNEYSRHRCVHASIERIAVSKHEFPINRGLLETSSLTCRTLPSRRKRKWFLRDTN